MKVSVEIAAWQINVSAYLTKRLRWPSEFTKMKFIWPIGGAPAMGCQVAMS
jgi:hypothetical protein